MLDGAEGIVRDEGYAALTSGAVAERCGVKQRLVYYYFQTMDDLIVECFRRLAAREVERLRAAQGSAAPLQALWEVATHSSDARLVAEFMAMANRIERLKHEVVSFIEHSRELQAEIVAAALASRPGPGRLTPAALVLLASSIALAINREAQLGVRLGHAELMQAIEAMLDAIAGGCRPAALAETRDAVHRAA